MSSTGVSSKASTPVTYSIPFLIFSNFKIEKPIGLGLLGLRVENTPKLCS